VPDQPIHPQWLSIDPIAGVLLSSESIAVALRVWATCETVPALNMRTVKLAATLILHMLLCKDHFVALVSAYRASRRPLPLPRLCTHTAARAETTYIGKPLGELAHLEAPIRASAALANEEHAIHAPREVSARVSWLLAGRIEDVVRAFFLLVSCSPRRSSHVIFRGRSSRCVPLPEASR
jgi:phosphatidylinositol-bisphosphatase